MQVSKQSHKQPSRPHLFSATTLLIISAGATTVQAKSPPVESHIQQIAALSITELTDTLKAHDYGKQILSTLEPPQCGVTFNHATFQTIDAEKKPTTSSMALLIPTGGAACTGKRPIVLYAHGTTTDKTYNLASINDNKNPAYSELLEISAAYAAQGYIVIAPNYAGYDISTLPYHPYLIAAQQSQEMIDALATGRGALKKKPPHTISDSGRLFVTGYSQGGYVAMATAKEMDRQGIKLTASVPMSGPYALAAFGDAMFGGRPNLGMARYAALFLTGLQKAYGNIYQSPKEVYTAPYAEGIETLLPSTFAFNELAKAGKLPNATFQSAPNGVDILEKISPVSMESSLGFDAKNYLVNTDYRARYVADMLKNPDGSVNNTSSSLPAEAPQNTLRQALKDNDLRSYIPKSPMLMCGGGKDPIVFFDVNSKLMTENLIQASKAGKAVAFAQLDVDASATPGTFTSVGLSPKTTQTLKQFATEVVQPQFTATVANVLATRGQGALFGAYHGHLVSLACDTAALKFFNSFK